MKRGQNLKKNDVLLFIIFSNKLNNLVNSSNKNNIIICCQNKDITSLRLLDIISNNIARPTKMNKSISRKNKNTSHFDIKEKMSDVK